MTLNFQVNNAAVKNLIRGWYEDVLNGSKTWEIVSDGSDSTLRSEFETGNTAYIYFNGSLIIQGEVEETENFQGGGITMTGQGLESELQEDYKCPTDTNKNTKTWISESAHTIFSDIVTNATGWNVNTSNSTDETLDSFRVDGAMSVWNGIIRFIEQTNKDIYVEDSTKTVYLYDTKRRTNVAEFIEQHNIGSVSWTKKKPEASKVIVYGKGDGDNQIIGSAGSGTPVKEIRDGNIISPTQAATRAQKELDKIQNSIFHYTFDVYNVFEDLQVGDSVTLTAESAGITNQTVDVTRIRRGNRNGQVNLQIEVTDQNHRKSSRDLSSYQAKQAADNRTYQSSMQGSGNTQHWGNAINAKNGASTKVVFFLSDNLIKDEAGNFTISSMTVDYDVDPFRNSAGTASFDGGDPQVQGNSADTEPGVEGNTDSASPDINGNTNEDGTNDYEQDSDDSYTSLTLDTGETVVGTINPNSNNTAGIFIWMTLSRNISSTINDFDIEVDSSSGVSYFLNWFSVVAKDDTNGEASSYFACFIPENTWNKTYDIIVETNGPTEDFWQVQVGWITLQRHNHSSAFMSADNHPHGSSGMNAADHPHGDGSYEINATDIDNISISDDVSDAASINATSVNIHLDYYDPTDAGANVNGWIEDVYLISNTGKTIDTDVDITNGGTLPDKTGYWRVRIDTDSASADYVQGIVKLKHALDN